jgi:hypothetical protein
MTEVERLFFEGIVAESKHLEGEFSYALRRPLS